LAIGVCQECNSRRTVRIVLDRNHSCRNTGLVALEIHNAQLALVPAATESHGGIARVAAPALPVFRLGQGLVRPVGGQVRARKRGPVSQSLRCRSVSLDCHKNQLLAFSSYLFPTARCVRLADDQRRTTNDVSTNSVRTPASFRRLSVLRMPFSSL